MLYFTPKVVHSLDFERLDLLSRHDRIKVVGFKNAFFIYPGDVLEIFFIKRGTLFKFEGFCLALKKKFFKDPNTSVLLRTHVQGIGIECIFSYFYNRAYNFTFQDFKRKFDTKKKAKLYFLRATVLK